jgi:uncharacterized protein (TIGR02452 family)
MKKTKKELMEIYNDTKRTAMVCDFPSITKKYSTDLVLLPLPDPVILVIDSDTVSAAVEYSAMGKTCVLNMASPTTAGGGSAEGHMAQEECLFRCSNLPCTVTQDFYPLLEEEALYSKDVVFLKDANYEYMEFIKVDVVTIASVNLNANSTFDEETNQHIDGIVEKDEDYRGMMLRKIRLMLTIAINNDVEHMILGAWGCGVFKNDPYEVAEFFNEVLLDEDYAIEFKTVVFAIINDNNSVADNLSIFKECIDGQH